MDAGIVETIAEQAQMDGIELEARPDYSGRGMYGSTTGGLVGDIGDIAAGVAIFARECDDDQFEDLVESLRNARTDSMGRQLIVY